MADKKDSRLTQKEVIIFADGACKGNPGPGGYAAILRTDGQETELSGSEPRTTNNRMELTAVIKAFESLKADSKVRVVTDSNYVVKGMTEWLPNWLKKGWKNSQGGEVLNRDLWERLYELTKRHKVQWEWIKGHNGHPENERCDRLANEAIKKLKSQSTTRRT